MSGGPLGVLGDAQRAGRVPSMSAGLVRDGALVWADRVGDGPGAASGEVADTQHRIGSITKTFTAVLVHQLAAEGLVDLAAPLSAYVSETPFGDRTLHGVLSHSAGLPTEPTGPWWERRGDAGDFAELVAANTGVAPMAAEGVEHRYSNLGYGLLGEVVARVRGEDWWTSVQRRILEPLGMARTTYQPSGAHARGWSVSHLLGTLTPEPHTDTGAMAPAGQLWSTLGDLATYAGFLANGHPDVLPLEVLDAASREVVAGSEYALGLRVVPDAGRTLVGHTGTMPGFMACCLVDRASGEGVVAFADATVGQQSVELATALLATLDEPPGDPGTPWRATVDVPDDVRALVGSWYWGERAFELRWDDGLLHLVELRGEPGGVATEEYHATDQGWVGTDRTLLEVVRAADGSVSHLLSTTYLFTRTPYDPRSPVPGGAPGRA